MSRRKLEVAQHVMIGHAPSPRVQHLGCGQAWPADQRVASVLRSRGLGALDGKEEG